MKKEKEVEGWFRQRYKEEPLTDIPNPDPNPDLCDKKVDQWAHAFPTGASFDYGRNLEHRHQHSAQHDPRYTQQQRQTEDEDARVLVRSAVIGWRFGVMSCRTL